MCKFNMFITAVCVLFLIKLRWPKNKSIYDTRITLLRDNLQKVWKLNRKTEQTLEKTKLNMKRKTERTKLDLNMTAWRVVKRRPDCVFPSQPFKKRDLKLP